MLGKEAKVDKMTFPEFFGQGKMDFIYSCCVCHKDVVLDYPVSKHYQHVICCEQCAGARKPYEAPKVEERCA